MVIFVNDVLCFSSFFFFFYCVCGTVGFGVCFGVFWGAGGLFVFFWFWGGFFLTSFLIGKLGEHVCFLKREA